MVTAGTMRRWAPVVAVVVAAGLALGACAGRSEGTSASGDARATEGAPAPQAGFGGGEDGVADESAAAADPAAPEGASLAVDAPEAPPSGTFISTAELTVEVDDVAATKPRVVAVAEAAGGALFAEQTSYGSRARSVITIKVPPARFSTVLGELAGLGQLASQKVSTEDVTEQVVDLDARITAIEASLERTRELLGRATTLADISHYEREVVRRQADLERLRGQQRTLQGRIALATVVVTLDGPTDATPAVRERDREPEPEPLPGFGDGLEGGWSVARTLLSVGAAALGASLPFLPVVVLVVLALRWRRSRRPSPSAPLPPQPASPAGPTP